jgi:hypothetical protein
MTEWHMIYLFNAHGGKQAIREATVTGAPERARAADVADQLAASPYATRFATHGAWMANRRLVQPERLPEDTRDAADAVRIDWADLTDSKPRQVNFRAPAGEHASWTRAAQLAGAPNLQTWIRDQLNDAAKRGSK